MVVVVEVVAAVVVVVASRGVGHSTDDICSRTGIALVTL